MTLSLFMLAAWLVGLGACSSSTWTSSPGVTAEKPDEQSISDADVQAEARRAVDELLGGDVDTTSNPLGIGVTPSADLLPCIPTKEWRLAEEVCVCFHRMVPAGVEYQCFQEDWQGFKRSAFAVRPAEGVGSKEQKTGAVEGADGGEGELDGKREPEQVASRTASVSDHSGADDVGVVGDGPENEEPPPTTEEQQVGRAFFGHERTTALGLGLATKQSVTKQAEGARTAPATAPQCPQSRLSGVSAAKFPTMPSAELEEHLSWETADPNAFPCYCGEFPDPVQPGQEYRCFQREAGSVNSTRKISIFVRKQSADEPGETGGEAGDEAGRTDGLNPDWPQPQCPQSPLLGLSGLDWLNKPLDEVRAAAQPLTAERLCICGWDESKVVALGGEYICFHRSWGGSSRYLFATMGGGGAGGAGDGTGFPILLVVVLVLVGAVGVGGLIWYFAVRRREGGSCGQGGPL